jgi:hypothetical protein
MACRLYVITVLVETTIDLIIEGDLLLRFHEADQSQPPASPTDSLAIASKKMPVFLSVFALAQCVRANAVLFSLSTDIVFSASFSWVWHWMPCTLETPYSFSPSREFERFFYISLMVFTIVLDLFSSVFNALFLVYAIIQSSEIRQTSLSLQSGFSHIPVNVLTTVLPIVISIAELAYVALAWTIYNEFGWKVYKFLGADRQIKKMFAVYQIFQCLVKFDVFFWVGFCVQFTFLVLDSHSWQFYVTCAALPLSIVLLVEGHLAARYENKWMMGTFLTGCVGAMIYFCYKVLLQSDCLNIYLTSAII